MKIILPLAIALSVFVPSARAQTLWYVDAAATPPGTGQPGDPYTGIQQAIAQATTQPGDTVIVAPGTYGERIDFLGKDIVVVGALGAAQTVIDGGQAGTVASFTSGETGAAVLRGFTLRGGTRTTVGSDNVGGGILCVASSPTVDACIVTDNGFQSSPRFGGGLYVSGSTAAFVDCTFAANFAHGAGGGAYVADGAPTFLSCRFVANTFGPSGCAPMNGGGAAAGVGTVFSGCTFADNVAASGGGLEGAATALDCTFTGNTGQFGGGARNAELIGCTLIANEGLGYLGECGFGGGAMGGTLRDCLVAMNVACEGGGVHQCLVLDSELSSNRAINTGPGHPVLGGGASASDLERCLVQDNQALDVAQAFGRGGALYGGTADNCTVVGNRTDPGSGGVDGATVTSSIVWSNTPAQVAGSAFVTYSNVQGGWVGAGNLDVDPGLSAGFELPFGSPSIDTGDPASPADADGSRRDMGAFPYAGAPVGSPYCLGVANSTGRGARSFASGSASVAANGLELRSQDVPPMQFGYYLMSRQRGYLPAFGGGEGIQCLALPIVRFRSNIIASGTAGTMPFVPDLAALPQGTVVAPGETMNFQLWYRDGSGPTLTSSTSDGVTVVFE